MIERIRPPELYRDAPYAYASVLREHGLVFAAGACPIDEHGVTVAPGDPEAQAASTAFDNFLDFRLFLGALTRFELIDGLHDDVGVSHQIVVHTTFEFVFRRVRGEIYDLMPPTKPRIESNPCSRRSHQDKRQDQPGDKAPHP
jgi:hypothetical protein